ncbi:RNA polymerase sigma-70 factor [Mangrovibacterium diazotrophicum]|uniref:RNA polymerase sigma-70 factor (ECF subfamily) n=1 Tax=Mangrovibacterium diazotrophicum TaxID=1261403 RepID=A0A419W5G3_9BACT|nr:RNA polymerase sigma-70 factor [Mangrovibacterium diazotrophicum]RKD90684.1 RNA polymerase sigma-70 factor (ECF subfamily) [Mangrovibacterium diazotrophicum]
MAVHTKYLDDNDILEQIAKGDLGAYRCLFDKYFAELCNFLLIYLRDKSFAEEVALDIFAVVWERREQLHVHTNIRAYLFTAGKNKAISIFRRSKQHLLSSLDVEDQPTISDLSSEQYLENKELRELINRAIASLPEQSRKIYQLAWEENLSHKEIAEKLDLSPKTVENHVGIALRKLREQLSPYYRQIFLLCISGF